MIFFSEQESQLFKVRFGRYEGILESLSELRSEIISAKYDFVRIKLKDPGNNLFVRLHELNFPFQLLDIHRFYSRDFQEFPASKPTNSPVHLIRHEGSLSEEIKHMVLQTFDEHPMGFFTNEVVEKYFPVSLQLQNVAEYIATHHCHTINPGKQSWLIKVNDEMAGCSSTVFLGDEAYTTYIGLLPQYRKKSIYAEVIAAMQYEIEQSGARYCTGSARLHNLSSQSVFERQGEKYIRHDYVLMLMPLLNIGVQ